MPTLSTLGPEPYLGPICGRVDHGRTEMAFDKISRKLCPKYIDQIRSKLLMSTTGAENNDNNLSLGQRFAYRSSDVKKNYQL